METTEKTYEERVKEMTKQLFTLRDEKGVTNADWSAESGFSKGRIEKIERGEELATLGVLIKLAHGLGYEVRLQEKSA